MLLSNNCAPNVAVRGSGLARNCEIWACNWGLRWSSDFLELAFREKSDIWPVNLAGERQSARREHLTSPLTPRNVALYMRVHGERPEHRD